MSASDDRSVRVWTVKLTATEQAGVKQPKGTASPEAAPVLYGHSARLWDCHFGEGILITASEDCTARCVPQQQKAHDSAVWLRQKQADAASIEPWSCCHSGQDAQAPSSQHTLTALGLVATAKPVDPVSLVSLVSCMVGGMPFFLSTADWHSALPQVLEENLTGNV